MTTGSRLSRRQFFMRTGIAAAGTLLLPSAEVFAKALSREKSLQLYNANTKEEFCIQCSPQEHYEPRLMRQFSHFLRDHHQDSVHPMDPGLIDLLFAVSVLTRSAGTFEIISGYRSPATNHSLRKQHHGVAEHSLHTHGKAMDIRLSDTSAHEIQRAGMALQMGGVGYYPRENFVHLDTGDVRYW
jgi:uncharacterized protein YcbK (DUF882 family)